MPTQKLTTHQIETLTRWDADYYKSLTDDDCIVCLTEREVYLLGQIIEQLTWSNTRWIGDKSGLDFKAIAGNLEYKLSERMTCENLSSILTTVINLQETVTELQSTVNIIYNETMPGADIPIFDAETTTVSDTHTPQELSDFGVTADTCDTAGKDATYGAVSQLVRYINQVNIDLLERVNQAGNLPDQIARLISAIPVLGLLPIDEIFSWAQFIATELEDEYNATVDEALLQSVICDLFCIAVANNCHLDFNDVYNYFAGKVSPTLGHATTTFLSLVQFGTTGTFAGDDYFYYFCYFQLTTVGLGQFFFGVNSLNDYAYQARAGLNSPDNDWEIFCLDCPPLYRLYTHDFEQGQLGWEIDTLGVSTTDGVWDGNRWKGTLNQFNEYVIQIKLPHTSTWRIRGAALYMTRQNGLSDGSRDTCRVRIRPTVDSNTGSTDIVTGSFLPNGEVIECDERTASPFYWTGANQLNVACTVAENGGAGMVYLNKIEILYELLYAPLGAVITEDDNICE